MTVRRRLAATLTAATLAFASTASAWATDEPLEDSYASLTAALLSVNAAQSGMALDTWLANNNVMVSTIDGTTGVVAAEDGQSGVVLNATDPTELAAQLRDAGFGLDLRAYNSLDDLAQGVVDNRHTADATVTLAGAQWMAELGALRVGTLTTPQVAGVSVPQITRDALPLGLLLDQSIAGTIAAAPDLYAQVSASGVGSAELAQVFSREMAAAWEATSTSISDVLPSKAVGAMMAVMASGSAKAADAYPGIDPACTTGGLYLNSIVQGLFAPTNNRMSNQSDKQMWTFETLWHMPDWQRADLLAQNPDLVQALLAEDGTAGGALLCDTASAGTSATLQDALPGIFGQLRAD